MTLLKRWAGTEDDAELKRLVTGWGRWRFWLGAKVMGVHRLHAYAEGWHRLRDSEERQS